MITTLITGAILHPLPQLPPVAAVAIHVEVEATATWQPEPGAARDAPLETEPVDVRRVYLPLMAKGAADPDARFVGERDADRTQVDRGWPPRHDHALTAVRDLYQREFDADGVGRDAVVPDDRLEHPVRAGMEGLPPSDALFDGNEPAVRPSHDLPNQGANDEGAGGGLEEVAKGRSASKERGKELGEQLKPTGRGELDSLVLTVFFVNESLLFAILLMVREWVPAGWRRRATILCMTALLSTVAGGALIFQLSLDVRHTGSAKAVTASSSNKSDISPHPVAG